MGGSVAGLTKGLLAVRIIFSRKGFDSAAGGGASPIIDGRPVSLPIPSGGYSRTSYADLGLGDAARGASRGRVGADDLCHHDPMFLSEGTCLFGQCGAAQTHLANQGVTIGDVFLFFGLFREEATGEPHHRIFGYQRIARIVPMGGCEAEALGEFITLGHPHALGMHATNDVIYVGDGRTAARARPELRLTVDGGPPSLWNRPAWMRPQSLSYHADPARWLPGKRMRSVARGQEFVCKIGKRPIPRRWLEHTIALIWDEAVETRDVLHSSD